MSPPVQKYRFLASACSSSLSLALASRRRVDRLLSGSARSCSKVSDLYPVSARWIVTDSNICTVPVIDIAQAERQVVETEREAWVERI